MGYARAATFHGESGDPQQIQMLGFYLAGFLCLVLAVLKLTIEGHWSWWRVFVPLWVVLGHNALYITVCAA